LNESVNLLFTPDAGDIEHKTSLKFAVVPWRNPPRTQIKESETGESWLYVTNKVIADLEHDPVWLKQVWSGNFAMRRHPGHWRVGKFIHSHDVCFDDDGNIYLAEWVAIRRVSFLKHVG